MKTNYFYRANIAKGRAVTLTLPFQMLPVSEGEAIPQDIDVEDIARLCVRVKDIGETGLGHVITTEGVTRYELDGTMIHIYIAPVQSVGEMAVTVDGSYGQVRLHAVLYANVVDEAETEIVADPYTFSAISGGGGGGDYKTDIYMDGDGRVMVERIGDGGTLILDEHENPILKRNADGSTQYFDAYQSARLMIGAHGGVEVAYTDGDVVKTLQVAEAILARTQKHLLSNTVGETTIKDEEGNILTHAQIYDMLMNTPDFVVLVRADHAFHPNLVTETQIAFTCSYLGADGQISAERVNITNANVVSYTIGKGIARGANGGVTIGEKCVASGVNSFASGYSTKAYGDYAEASCQDAIAQGSSSHAEGLSCATYGTASHAEGWNTKANGWYAHAEGESTKANGRPSHAEGVSTTASGFASHTEGNYTTANGGTSHAEGNYCTTGTSGGSAHAEGSYTTANGAASHTEGYRTTTTEGGSHAQGCWNKVEGGAYAFMHGCGTSENDLRNALLIAGSDIYVYGVGGYDGTNYGAEGVKSLREVLLGQ